MKLWTIQMAQWREAEKRGIPVVNTTVKSGVEAFAPTWFIVLGHKQGFIGDGEYTEEYYDIIRQKQWVFQKDWKDLLNMPEVAIACYCRAGNFCHRYLLRDIIKQECIKREIPFEYAGEIKAGG